MDFYINAEHEQMAADYRAAAPGTYPLPLLQKLRDYNRQAMKDHFVVRKA